MLLAFGNYVVAQNTTISGTMVDTDGTAWVNGTWRLVFRPNPQFPNENQYRLLNGAPLNTNVTHQSGTLNATTGGFVATIYDSTLITPTGSGWTLTICPLASAPCGTFQFVAAGSSMNVSSNLTAAIPAPRFTPIPGAFGYADINVITSLNIGAQYWNVVSGNLHCFNGQVWVVCSGGGGGGGGTPPGGNVGELQTNGGSGVFTATAGMTWLSFSSTLSNPNGGINAGNIHVGQLILNGVAVNTLPICPNGPNNSLTTIGCQNPVGPMGPPGPPGGSLSYPGVVSDGNNGLNVQGAVSTSSLPGYRQNQVSARARNRDEVLQLTVTPQDFPNCQLSGRGLLDDTPCFCAAINYLNSTDFNVTRKLIVPYTQYGYYFRSSCALQPLPHDYGDYTGSAGFNVQANVALQIIDGSVTTCTVSGGSGYTASTATFTVQLPVYIFDPTLQGSGAYATVSTDTSGTPNGCTVVQPGKNYPTVGVLTGVSPIGGDGAAGYANMQNGVFTVGAITSTAGASGQLTAGGSGYNFASTTTGFPPVLVAQGGTSQLTCTTPPNTTSTVTGTSITQVNITTTGAGCTWTGTGAPCTASPCQVPLVFGASCGGVQCTLMNPEPVVNMPCAVPLINNLTIEGIGNPTIQGTWSVSTSPYDATQLIAFCEPSGQNSYGITIKNLNIDKIMIGFYFPWELQRFIMDNVNFGANVGIPFHTFAFTGGFPQGNSPVSATYASFTGSAPPYSPSSFTNINNNALAGFTCGGEWISRNPVPYASAATAVAIAGGYQTMLGAAAGGVIAANRGWYDRSHWINYNQSGQCGNVVFANINSSITPGNNFSPAIDSFYETYIWKTQNGPITPFTNTTNLMSNGMQATSPNGNSTGPGCRFVNAITTDRTVDYQFGFNLTSNPILTGQSGSGGLINYPWYQCYPGISLIPFLFLPRYSGNTATLAPSVSFSNITARLQGNRPLIMGRFDDLTTSRLMTTIQAGASDSYSQVGRTLANSSVTVNSPIITNATGNFSSLDIGSSITGSFIPNGTTIATVQSATQVTMSLPASSTSTTTATVGAESRGLFVNNTSRVPSYGRHEGWWPSPGFFMPAVSLRNLVFGLDDSRFQLWRNIVSLQDKSFPFTGTIVLPATSGSSITGGTCTTGTISLGATGLYLGPPTAAVVAVSPSVDPGAVFTWSGFLSTGGNLSVVTVKLCAASTATPIQTTYNVRILP